MSDRSLTTACIHYAAWLGVMLNRHASGKRLIPRIKDSECVERDAAAMGIQMWGRSGTADEMPIYEPAIDALLRRVLDAGKGWRHEDELHGVLLSYCPTTPAADIVDELIARNDAHTVCLLGHCRLSDRHLWMLGGQVEEAATTLAIRRYVNNEYSADQFEEVLHSFSENDMMFKNLPQYTPSSEEKARTLVRLVSAYPKHIAILEARKYHHPLFRDAVSGQDHDFDA